MSNNKQQYFYFYKITNNINGHFYYGIHTTNNLNDNYMGSGVRLHQAYKKYGLENFSKEIIEYFDNIDDLYKKEAEVVNEELIKNPNCYNIALGGKSMNFYNKVCALGKNNEMILLDKNSEEYKSGNYISYWANKTLCKNEDGSYYWIETSKFDPNVNMGIRRGIVTVKDKETGEKNTINVEDYDKSKYEYINSGKVIVKDGDGYKSISREEWQSGNYNFMFKDTCIVSDKNGNHFRMSIHDPNYHKYDSLFKDKKFVKDKNGNKFWIEANDPRWLSGELVGITKGYKMPEHVKEILSNIKSTKDKICICNKELNKNKYIYPNDLSVYENDGWERGMIIKNSNSDKIMVNNGKKQIKIHKDVLNVFLSEHPEYIKGGLKKGKSGRIYINKDGKNKHILLEEQEKYINEGWALGRLMKDQSNCIHIYNDELKQNKFIDKIEAQTFLENGWKLGMLKRKRI